MNPSMLDQLPALLDDLSEEGWARMPLAMTREACLDLSRDLDLRYHAGFFRAARVGQGQRSLEQKALRSDQIDWIGPGDPELSVQHWLHEMEELTAVLNRNFFLALNSFDCHFACYEPGTYYRKHLDRFRDDPGRILSVILFLNENWLKADDGELLIYDPSEPDRIIAEVRPEMGTLVVFKSHSIPHEVRTTKRRRLSLSGWLASHARGSDGPFA